MRLQPAKIFGAALVALCLQDPAAAQQPGVIDQQESHSVTIANGVESGTFTFSTYEFTTAVTFVTVELLRPDVFAEALVPPRGPNTFMPLKSLAESSGAPVSVMSLDLAPPFGESAGLVGLRMTNGRLYSWPPRGVELVLQSDGSAAFTELPEGLATIKFSDGILLPLGSLNGPVVHDAQKASLYTGALSTGDSLLAELRDCPAVAVLQQEDGDDPNALFLDTPDKDRRFVSKRVTDGGSLELDTNQAALVLPTPADPALLDRLRNGATLEITISVDPMARFARTVVPVGARFLHDGVFVDGAARTVRNGIALDAEGRRLRAFSTATSRGSAGADVKKLSEFLVKEGFTEGVMLDERLPLLAPNWKERDQYHDTAMAPTRLALVVREGKSTLAAPELDKKISRIPSVVMDGTRREFPINQPSSLYDGRQGASPGLNQFWASPIRPDEPALISMLLPKAQPVAAIEIIHAEAVGFSPQFDLREFKISGRAKTNGDWMPLATVTHDKPVSRERVILPGSPILQELRMEIVTPSFLPNGNTARIAELILWGPAE